MKLILINGSTCSGKSTVVKGLLKRQENLYHLSYDALKWSFSQYSPDKHIEDVRAVMLSIADTVLERGYDVVCDAVLFKAWREKLLALGMSHGCETIEINLEADFDTLSRRFDERVRDAQAHPEKRISNLSKERFKELFGIYEKEKNATAITLRSDQQPVDEITEEILKITHN